MNSDDREYYRNTPIPLAQGPEDVLHEPVSVQRKKHGERRTKSEIVWVGNNSGNIRYRREFRAIVRTGRIAEPDRGDVVSAANRILRRDGTIRRQFHADTHIPART